MRLIQRSITPGHHSTRPLPGYGPTGGFFDEKGSIPLVGPAQSLAGSDASRPRCVPSDSSLDSVCADRLTYRLTINAANEAPRKMV